MPERILGLGQQKSLRKVMSIAESEFRERQGGMREIVVSADDLKCTASRAKFEGPWDSYTLHVDARNKAAAKAVEAAATLGSACVHTEEDGVHTFVCSGKDASDADAQHKAIEHLGGAFTLPETWRMDAARFRTDPISVELIFRAMVQYKASDAHLTPGRSPIFRIDNQARASELMGELSAEQILTLIKSVAPERDWEIFLEKKQCSFSYQQRGVGFSRASAFIKGGLPHLTFRFLAESIPTFDDLNIDKDLMERLATLHNGLLLVTGMTGSGKSTTAASILEFINNNRSMHILTIEDPIEYTFVNKKSFVSQRQLGVDIATFGEGVEGGLRQDPDVILIGEMKDADTIRAAMSAASTGHLVISTLHASNASGVVNRIASFFEPSERDLVRQQLVDSLRCVICQKLIPKKGGGRIPALEIMFNDVKHIATSIVDGNTLGIRIGMQQNLSSSMLFEQYLHGMYTDDKVELKVAKEASPELDMFDQILMGTYSVPRIV